MFIGTLGAIKQNKIKRLFAYSSIAHVGYLLISLATGTIESIESLLIYAVLYMLTVICMFSILLVMSRENFNLDEDENFTPVTYQPTITYLNNLTETYNSTSSVSAALPTSLISRQNTTNSNIFTTGQSYLLSHNLSFSSSKLNIFQKSNPNPELSNQTYQDAL
jgi:hypothetical protein